MLQRDFMQSPKPNSAKLHSFHCKTPPVSSPHSLTILFEVSVHSYHYVTTLHLTQFSQAVYICHGGKRKQYLIKEEGFVYFFSRNLFGLAHSLLSFLLQMINSCEGSKSSNSKKKK